MGIDVGSTSAKVVVVDAQGGIRHEIILPIAGDTIAAIRRAVGRAVESDAGVVTKVVATGVGGEMVAMEHERVTEMTCHRQGCRHLFADCRSVIDIGGQDTKAILVSESIYRMNTACAAGTGRFIESMARALNVEISEMALLDGRAARSVRLSRVCTVFGETEVVNRLASGEPVEEIVRGVHDLVADKAVGLLQRVSPRVEHPVVLSGGVAMNGGVVRAINERLGTRLLVPERPQMVGALGAALIARELHLGDESRAV